MGRRSNGWEASPQSRQKSLNKRQRKALKRRERKFSEMVQEQRSKDKTAFTFARVRLESVPAAISCSMHPELEGASDTFIIHSRGTSELAMYFCIRCERDLLIRLVEDFVSYPGHAAAMGALNLPVEMIEKLEELGAVGLGDGREPAVIHLGPGPGGAEIVEKKVEKKIVPIRDVEHDQD